MTLQDQAEKIAAEIGVAFKFAVSDNRGRRSLMQGEIEMAAVGRLICNVAVVVVLLAAAGHSAATDSPWQKISVPAGKYTVAFEGHDRDIYPGCVLPGVTGDSNYSFYFKPGKTDKLLVFFNGGGACFNFTTCVASLQTQSATYVPTADIPLNQPQFLDGIFNLARSDNPYRDWSMLFLPYCTGDIHIGSNDAVYDSGTGASATIRHRGFDNFLFARNWITPIAGSVTKVLVAGSSAGGYGAALNFPYLREAFPNAKALLLADGANGVITDSFLATAIKGPNASWAAAGNLAPLFTSSGLLLQNANSFIVAAYRLLTLNYPKDLFSQYTTAWDASQTLFYNIMLNPNNIPSWPNIGSVLGLWDYTMVTFASMEAAASNHYRYYIAPGCEHTILRYSRFYSTAAIGNVSFVDWIQGLTDGQPLASTSKWQNLSCNPLLGGCPPPTTAEQIAACF